MRSAAGSRHSEPRGYLLKNGVGPGPEAPGTSRRDAYPTPAPAPARSVFCPMVFKRVAAEATSVRNVVAFIMEQSPVGVEGVIYAGFLRRL